MDCYHCEVCNMFSKPKSKPRHFKSNKHKNLDKHKHIKITIEYPNLNNIDKIFHTHIIEYNNKYEYYLVRCEFILLFSTMQGYLLASSFLSDKKTMVFRKIFVENAIKKFKNEGFDFSHITQANIIIVCNKKYMTLDFYMKHKMHAIDWKLNATINKNKSLINKFPQNWKHPLNRKFERYSL